MKDTDREMQRLAGVSLPTNHDYSSWQVGMGETFVNIADGMGGAEQMYDAGALPYIHVMFHPNRQPGATIQNIAAGTYDDLLLQWLTNLKRYCDTGRKAVVVYLPEFNGNWTVYANDNWSTDALKTAFRRFVQMGRDRGLDETMVKWSWAPNDTGFGGLANWYPGDLYVDQIGGSAYNDGGIFEFSPWQTPADLYNPFVAEVREFTDKMIIVTQTGCVMNPHTDEQQEWLQQMVDYVGLGTIDGAIYYNELQYQCDQEDFNDKMSVLNTQRPDHWFEEGACYPSCEGLDMQHTSMQWLPGALTAAGVNVIELDGWEEAQGNYLWTDLDSGTRSYDGKPTCYMIHHTATTGYTPKVGGPDTWAKANCWAGLLRDGRLYQDGGGVPTIIFTSAGPARISSGYGHGPTLYEVADDVRVPWDQPSSDTSMAANRYAWNVETVHAGDGGPIDPGVEHSLAIMGALICERFGWSPWRAIGHLTWSKRKIDPFWDGRRDVIVRVQDTIALMMDDTVEVPIPPIQPPGGDVDYRTVKNVPDADWARNVVDTMLCLAVINEGDGSDWEKPLKNGTIWNYLDRYTTAIQRDKLDGC